MPTYFPDVIHYPFLDGTVPLPKAWGRVLGCPKTTYRFLSALLSILPSFTIEGDVWWFDWADFAALLRDIVASPAMKALVIQDGKPDRMRLILRAHFRLHPTKKYTGPPWTLKHTFETGVAGPIQLERSNP